ncbi:MAG: PadR family transcriptional regulator [Chloroflexi bacterium]|nr:PadR family transcriptional regulator [Chloroflexota bacterium]
MSLKHTLLAFLSYGPLTGYELKRHIDNSTQFFWHAALSQIYPTLKAMGGDGLIEFEVKPQEGKPDKKIYTITETGRSALLDWLAEPMDELLPMKRPALLKLFFSGTLDKETILDHFQRQLDLHRIQLTRYEQETSAYIGQIVAETGLVRESMLWELVRQFGEEHEHAYIRWLKQAIETIEQEL